MGARIDGRAGMRPPLVIQGGRLRGIDWTPEVASAQVKSAILLAGLFLEEGSVTVNEPAPSRDHTERLLEWLGAPLQRDAASVRLRAGSLLEARDWEVPGDISAAAFLLVGAAIAPESRVTVERVGINPSRAGALEVLRRMGVRCEVREEPVAGPEPVGSITAESSEIHPVEVGGEEIPRLIDEVPVLAVAAACARGTSRFRDVGDLRHKESDRIRSTCSMLRSLGVEVEEENDAFLVHGNGKLRGGFVAAQGDHRIAMSALVAGCAAEGEVEVDSLEMVATSDPGFAARLGRLRGES